MDHILPWAYLNRDNLCCPHGGHIRAGKNVMVSVVNVKPWANVNIEGGGYPGAKFFDRNLKYLIHVIKPC
jgi:hypothetical protein